MRELKLLGEGYQKWMPSRIQMQVIKACVLEIGNDLKLMVTLNEMLEQIKEGNFDHHTALNHCVGREIPVVVKVKGAYTEDYSKRQYFLRRDEVGYLLYDTHIREDVSCLYMPFNYCKDHIELDLDYDYRTLGIEASQPF